MPERSSCKFDDARVDDRDADAGAVVAERGADRRGADGDRRPVVEAGGRTVVVDAEDLRHLLELLQDAVGQLQAQTVDDPERLSVHVPPELLRRCAPGTKVTITLIFSSPFPFIRRLTSSSNLCCVAKAFGAAGFAFLPSLWCFPSLAIAAGANATATTRNAARVALGPQTAFRLTECLLGNRVIVRHIKSKQGATPGHFVDLY